MNREPNYLPELARLIAAGLIPVPRGAVVSVVVSHDDGCDIFGGKPCNCSPEIHPGRPPVPSVIHRPTTPENPPR